MKNVKEAEVIFKSLANKRRVLIFIKLASQKHVSVGVLAKEIKLSIEATSRHLNLLYRADLLNREQKSLVVFYSLNRENKIVKELIQLLANLRN